MAAQQPNPERMSREEFARRYRQVQQTRDRIEVDLQTRLSRVFARQGRVVTARLAAIRKTMVTDVPLTASAAEFARRKKKVAPVQHAGIVPVAPLPTLSSGEVFMGGFDDVLHDELDTPIREHTSAIGAALIGVALFGTAAALHPHADQQVQDLTSRLAYIGSETGYAVQQVLTADARNGSDFDTLASHVSSLFDRLSGAASAAISRVEATAIVGGTATLAARLAEVDTARMWVSQQDERVRETHWDADGQVVGLDEPFTVGDEELDFPGDPKGSPAETANCRCFVVFVPADANPDTAEQDAVDQTANEGDLIDSSDTADLIAAAAEFAAATNADWATVLRPAILAAAAWDPDLHPHDEAGRFGEGGEGRPDLTVHTGRLTQEKIAAWKATLSKAAEGLDLHSARDRDEFRARVAKATRDTPRSEVDKMTTLLGGTPARPPANPDMAIDPNGRGARQLADAFVARTLQSGPNTGFKIGGRQAGTADEALAEHANRVRQRNEASRYGPVKGVSYDDVAEFPGLHASAAEMTDDEWAAFANNAAGLIQWYVDGADGQISWGEPGAFADCVNLAGDHVEDPEAFCAQREQDATGHWPGEKK